MRRDRRRRRGATQGTQHWGSSRDQRDSPALKRRNTPYTQHGHLDKGSRPHASTLTQDVQHGRTASHTKEMASAFPPADFNAPLDATQLVVEVASGTFAFNNHIKPANVRQLWEKLCRLIADTLRSQRVRPQLLSRAGGRAHACARCCGSHPPRLPLPGPPSCCRGTPWATPATHARAAVSGDVHDNHAGGVAAQPRHVSGGPGGRRDQAAHPPALHPAGGPLWSRVAGEAALQHR